MPGFYCIIYSRGKINMKYQVIVDSSKDIFGKKEPEVFKTCKTKKEAEDLVNSMYRARHFACLNEYYVKEVK